MIRGDLAPILSNGRWQRQNIAPCVSNNLEERTFRYLVDTVLRNLSHRNDELYLVDKSATDVMEEIVNRPSPPDLQKAIQCIAERIANEASKYWGPTNPKWFWYEKAAYRLLFKIIYDILRQQGEIPL